MPRTLLTIAVALLSPVPAFGQGPAANTLPTLEPLPPSALSATGVGADPFAYQPTAGGQRAWASAEALLWWVKSMPLPPTLTTFTPGSPSAVIPFGGVLGARGTIVLSPRDMIENPLVGGRLSAGMWLGDAQNVGLEVGGLLTATQVQRNSVQSSPTGVPDLRVPFFNPSAASGFPPGNTSFVLAIPGFANGGQILTAGTRLWGTDATALFRVVHRENLSVSLLTGFRYLDLQEDLSIVSRESLVGAGLFGTFIANDNFSTRNQFYGSPLGVRAEALFGRFFTSVRADVALGDNHESVSVTGVSTVFPPGKTPITTPGGIFAQGTNIGRQTHDGFAVVPEVRVRFGMYVTPTIRAFVGYDFFYISEAVRPGDQLDHVINFTGNPAVSPGIPLTGAARPAPMFNQSDFWAHGVNFGVQFRY
jgi:hypothetical protein